MSKSISLSDVQVGLVLSLAQNKRRAMQAIVRQNGMFPELYNVAVSIYHEMDDLVVSLGGYSDRDRTHHIRGTKYVE